MVNETEIGHGPAVLDLLRRSEDFITGQRIGDHLGISRVAVHKHIRHLKEAGYAVEANRRGYRLSKDPELRFSRWEFGPDEHITVFSEVDSTMDAAARLSRRIADEDFTVAAGTQNSGRDRRGRPWSSPEGGLWATRVLHPAGSALRIQLYTLAGAAVMARILEQGRNLEASLRWPADVLVGRRKIAGVLAEARSSGDRIDYLALGVGVNVNNPVEDGLVSLTELTGRVEDRRAVLRDWTAALERFLAGREFRSEEPPRWFNDRMCDLSQRVTIKLADPAGSSAGGRILGVDGLGRLRIATSEGERHFAPGDIISIQRIET